MIEEPLVLSRPLSLHVRLHIGSENCYSTRLLFIQTLPIQWSAEFCFNDLSIGCEEIKSSLGCPVVDVYFNAEPTVTKSGRHTQYEAGATDTKAAPVIARRCVHLERCTPFLEKCREPRPISGIRLRSVIHWPAIGRAGGPNDPTAPIIRFGDNIEPRRGRRVTDPQSLYFDSKEVEALNGAGIQPINCCSMFFTDRLCDPYYSRSPVLPRELSHDLTEMGVICRPELVFNYDHSVIDITCEDVDEEVPDWNLGSLKLERSQVQCLCKEWQVFRVGQPRCEIIGLVRPYFTQWHRDKTPKCYRGCHVIAP